MREIIFRGKRIDNGEWVEGHYHYSNWYLPPSMKIVDTTYHILPVGHGDSHKVAPETVGQFTGKTDKNGKKVFEHDILQIFTVWADGTVEKAGVGVIQWWEHDQCYVLATKEGYHIDDFGNLGRPEYYEVIGNIHDNRDLLEVQQ